MSGSSPQEVRKQVAYLIYDGECPFCNAYVRMTKIRKQIDLNLIDARTGSQAVIDAVAAGYNLNEGFVLQYGGRYYHGEEALHTLAMLSSRSDVFNRVTAWFFSNPKRAQTLYPILRFFRNLTLKLLGRKPLNC